MKTGIVLEINKKDAVIVSEESKFVLLKRRNEMYIGQQIIFDRSDILRKKNSNKYIIYSIACLLIVLLGIYVLKKYNSYQNLQPYFSVELETDERLSLEIDKNGNLIKAGQLNYKDKKFNILLKKYLKEAIKRLPKQERYLVISVSNYNNGSKKQYQKVLDNVKDVINRYSDRFAFIKYITLSREEIKEAKVNNLSPAKYNAYLDYKKQKEDIKLKEVPNLTIKGAYHKKDTNKILNWEIGFYYKKGEKVKYKNFDYICLNSHISQVDWSPQVALSLWERVNIKDKENKTDNNKVDDKENNNNNEDLKDIGSWAENNHYEVGDKVYYNDKIYICIQSHNSIVTWEPDKAVSLWKIYN
jgi:hypothetical protein